MDIEQFVALSEGIWTSMRSGHSLAFKQFEDVLSEIKIAIVNKEEPSIKNMIDLSEFSQSEANLPFEISWRTESNWGGNESESLSKGKCYLIPIPKSSNDGYLVRSEGYTEKINTVSNYYFLEDGTFILNSKYNHTSTEERIWFLSENVRCRASTTYTLDGKGILQTSFASEIRKINYLA